MTQTKQHQKKQTVVSVVSQMASLICTSGESSGKEEPSPSVSSESSVPCSVSLLSPSSSSQSVKYGNVVYVVLLFVCFYTFITFQFILQPVCAIPIGGMTGHSLVFMLLSPLRPEINTSRLLQKIFRKKNTLMRQKFKKIQVHDFTSISIALVGVDGQRGQVCVWVLVWWSGYNKMHQAFSFTDGGDSFGMGHTCHQLFIHLQDGEPVSQGCIQSQKIHRKYFLYFVANYLQNIHKKKMLF